MNKLLLLLIVFSLAGCSNKAIYDNVQINKRNACIKVPESQYEECIERANISYEEYERGRKEVVGE